MAVQDQNASGSSSVSPHSEPVIDSKEINSFGNDYTPKARKPYTIKKQREKWTDEEHQRFLEAVKLYGRKWREIEEHVGTKTAVQIRSHAQKFFSKVTRASNGELIDIPPPRPKRKPRHPYPRKSVDNTKGTIQSENSAFSKPAVTEKERFSPTSILSAFGSDAMSSALTGWHGRCYSPTSSTMDAQSNSSTSAEKENERGKQNSLACKRKGSFEFLQLSPTSDIDSQSLMELDSTAKDATSTEEHDTSTAPLRDIKLFGTTLVLANFQEPNPSSAENTNVSPKSVHHDFDNDDSNFAQTPLRNEVDTELTLGIAHTDHSLVPCAARDVDFREPQIGNPNSLGANYGGLLPYLAVCRSPSFYSPVYNNQVQKPLATASEDKKPSNVNMQKERSCTGTNLRSAGGVEIEKNMNAADCKNNCWKFKHTNTGRYVDLFPTKGGLHGRT